jgi:pimeloyl-ACP methyl ester carboxylesterase
LLALAHSSGMRTMGTQWATPMVHPSVVGSALFGAVLDMVERSNPAQFAAQINALLNRPDAAPVLPAVTCPTLVLTGREDLRSPPAQHEAIAHAIRGAVLCIVEQCGHMSTMEQPDAVNAAFVAWLKS